MSRPHALLRLVRQFHLYIGVFIAPAILFFAFTGALQTFSLHETTAGSSYQPPRWAMVLAQIHKKATPVIQSRKPAPAAAGHAGKHSGADHPHPGDDPAHDHVTPAPGDTHASPTAATARAHHPLPLKIFFLLVSLGLGTSTLTGLYMSWKFAQRRHGLLLGLFVSGIIVPVVLVFV